jgi:tRNA threonylcarbamoyladenosine biosynthesis protein TsaE
MEVIFNLSEISWVSKMIIPVIKNYKVITFSGELGSGKTTLIVAVCKELGVIDPVSSPTFAIIQQYKTSKGNLIYHLDLYRIDDVRDAIYTGIEDAIQSGDLCFIEWPEKAKTLYPDQTLHISLEDLSGDKRKMVIQLP